MKRVSLIIMLVLILGGCSISGTIMKTSEKFKSEVSTCYNIFPISYADSDGDGYGDLNGITENIPKLSEELNVDCIWLNPIHPSSSYHKYDVDDYYAIDEMFGTLEDFEKLISVANDYDIEIILDLVINHSSTNNQLFIDFLEGKNQFYSTKSSDKEYSDNNWYTKNGVDYYGSFWEGMPEFNFENKEVRDYFKSVADYWLDLGVGGFRIDAAYHVYDTYEYENGFDTHNANLKWFGEFNKHIKKHDSDAFLVLEVWQPQNIVDDYFEVTDSSFNFDLAESIVKSTKVKTPIYIYDYLDSRFQTSSVTNERIESNFITNHDQNRLASDSITTEQLKLAANVSMSLPGITWIYYGEELGMSGMKPDEQIREPYVWNETTEGWIPYVYNNETVPYSKQVNDDESMYSHYSRLTAVRREYDISNATLTNLNVDNKILSYDLELDDEVIHVIHNFGSETVNITVDGEIIYGDRDLQAMNSTFILAN